MRKKRICRKNIKIVQSFIPYFLLYLGLAHYFIGASNSRKRSRDSTVVKPLDDDAEFEDACEQ